MHMRMTMLHQITAMSAAWVLQQIERIRGMRCWVKGAICDAADALLATCEAQLADLQQLWKLQA